MNLVGKKVGGYQVLEKIGSGGMATVYKALQPSLNRHVAVKHLHPEFAKDETIVERFEREALSIASLRHQNIIHIYDLVTRARNMSIVMEHVDGIDLYDILQCTHHLPVDIAAIIALKSVCALEHAHFHGVVHRDFKPSNLMVTKAGEVKLMDFGIARDESLGDLTLPGQAVGTPAYMSPEQVLGEDVDFRADLFSFGIVLYQMLTGEKPFRHEESRVIMQRIVNGEYRSARTIAPQTPWRLNRIIKRCLQKYPDKRYASTTLLRTELEKFVSSRVQLNLNERLVLFLQHRNLLSSEEATEVITSPSIDTGQLTTEDLGVPNLWEIVFKPVAAAALFLIGLMGIFHLGLPHLYQAHGHVRIQAPEDTSVFVDGVYAAKTPLDRLLGLKPGSHQVSFENKGLGERKSYIIEIVAEETQTLRAELQP